MKQNDTSNKIIRLEDRKTDPAEPTSKGRRTSGGGYPKIVAITSGKGGVGKTNIVANLGYTL
ncbi:MAG: hypothetical protein HZB87_09780, partial [Desulfatitalea sp.]|nr:hypothetical protein [Desulfatitalea sp.]